MSQSPRINLRQMLELAQRHHVAGQLEQAAALYRQILSTMPDEPNALNLDGYIQVLDATIDKLRGQYE